MSYFEKKMSYNENIDRRTYCINAAVLNLLGNDKKSGYFLIIIQFKLEIFRYPTAFKLIII